MAFVRTELDELVKTVEDAGGAKESGETESTRRRTVYTSLPTTYEGV